MVWSLQLLQNTDSREVTALPVGLQSLLGSSVLLQRLTRFYNSVQITFSRSVLMASA